MYCGNSANDSTMHQEDSETGTSHFGRKRYESDGIGLAQFDFGLGKKIDDGAQLLSLLYQIVDMVGAAKATEYLRRLIELIEEKQNND